MMLSNYGKVDPHMTVTLPQCVRLSPKHNITKLSIVVYLQWSINPILEKAPTDSWSSTPSGDLFPRELWVNVYLGREKT